MNRHNTQLYAHTNTGNGYSRLSIVPKIPGSIDSLAGNNFAQLSGDTLYTGKVIVADEPLCIKETRYVENSASIDDIKNGSAHYIGFKANDSLATSTTFILPSEDGNPNDVLQTDGSGNLSFLPELAGTDVASAIPFTTDNAVTRVDLPSGTRNIQQSQVLLDDSGNYSSVQSISLLQDSLDNTKYGYLALSSITTGDDNIAIGQALRNLTQGDRNVAIGHLAGNALTIGSSNVLIGQEAGELITSGGGNIGIGTDSLDMLETGIRNIAIGNSCLDKITGASDNICLGASTGDSLTGFDSRNIYIGDSTGTIGDNDVMVIGMTLTNNTSIRGIHGVTPAGGSDQMVIIDVNDRLGSQAIPTGDVTGGNSSIDNTIAIYNGGSGKVIQDSDIRIDSDDILSGASKIILEHVSTIGSLHDVHGLLITDSEELSVGAGNSYAIMTLATDEGLAITHSLFTGPTQKVITHHSGEYVNADVVLVLAADVTGSLSSGGAGNINIFSNLNDTITVKSSSKFSEIEFILDIFASNNGIAPSVTYSTGASSFAAFIPIDATEGFQQSGIMSWSANDLPLWVVDSSGNFAIKIERGRLTMSVTPRCDLVQVANTNTFSWDENADLTINSLSLLESGGPDLIKLQAPALAGSYTLTLPINAGLLDQVLTTSGTGILSWSAPPTVYPLNWMDELNVTWLTATTLRVEVGACRDSTDSNNINSITTISIDTTASGANGLDTGAMANDTWYAVHIIADSTLVNDEEALISLSDTAPTLPGTHDIFRRIGWVKTELAATDMHAFWQRGIDRKKEINWELDKSVTILLSEAQASIKTTIDFSSFAPTTCKEVVFNAYSTDAGGNDLLEFYSMPAIGGITVTNNSRFLPAKENTVFWTIGCNTSQEIQYSSDNKKTNLYSLGFIDEL